MALICESTVDPTTLPRIPVFGNRSNTWSVAINGQPTFEQAQERMRRIFVAWAKLFPAGTAISEPLVFTSITTAPLDIAEPPVQVGGIAELFSVRFNYLGPDAAIRWPTYVQRRRERIDPLCPLDLVDATVAAVAPSQPLDPGRPMLETRPFEDQHDLGLGPVDPGEIRDFAVKVALPLGAVAVGIAALWLLSRRGN